MKRQKIHPANEHAELLKVPFGAGRWEQRWRVPAVCLVLAAITFAVFGQTLGHEFVNFDDDVYVYENPVVAGGLTLKGLVWAFSCHAANWHPLTWISHMLDCQLYGLHPAGHHLTNVLLHTATVIALFLVLRQMTGALWRSAFVAAVFAIHPLRVESVAWVAERKDVLSGLFFMLTISAYVRYARGPLSAARYALVILLFAPGLMCKPMLVTLPLVLLLLDYWPLQRKEPTGRLLLEKLPLLALSAASCVATLLAQREAMPLTGAFSLPALVVTALLACKVYLCQMVYPVGLAVFYPFPHQSLPVWEAMTAGTLLAIISAAVVWQRRKRPWLLVGWVWYMVMLLPVLGIIQVGQQGHADRYTYLPQIGIYVALTWLAAEWRMSRAARAGLMAGVIGLFMVCAWQQTTCWQNSETLWANALACTTDNYLAQDNYGIVLMQKGRLDAAINCFQQALLIRPDFAEARNNLGNALLQTGKADEAIACFRRALQIRPDFAQVEDNLGYALLQTGQVDEAITHCQRAVQIKPNDAEACVNLGNAFFQKGRVQDAIAQFRKALQIKPGMAMARKDLDAVLQQMPAGGRLP
ncbi:MAG: tetratricopeptide repeat protein [Limisphaerales bacterium]